VIKIRLREVRERKLLTQVELAKRANLTQTTISAIEVGKHEPRISTVRQLAAALDVDAEELVINTAPCADEREDGNTDG
jgi:DNA-binding XRE family transcriptional regulator